MIWTTRPAFSLSLAMLLLPPPSAGTARARDDLDDLLRDRGLPHLVHVEGQPVDHVRRVVARGVHGGHARSMLRGRGLEQRLPYLDLHVLGEDLLEDRVGPR